MAKNQQLMENGIHVAFIGELFILTRDGMEFKIDKILEVASGHVKSQRTIYLSNIRMVFVASHPVGNFAAFDMTLLKEEIQDVVNGWLPQDLDEVPLQVVRSEVVQIHDERKINNKLLLFL